MRTRSSLWFRKDCQRLQARLPFIYDDDDNDDDYDDDDDDDVGVLRMTMIVIRLMLVIIRVMMLTMTMIMYSSGKKPREYLFILCFMFHVREDIN